MSSFTKVILIDILIFGSLWIFSTKKINLDLLCIVFFNLVFIFFIFLFYLDFSEDKKVNKLINNFYKKGNYYHCE